MILGFTGTRQNITPHQHKTLVEFFASHPITEFHHGDCVGADAAAHFIAAQRGIAIVIHPPTNSSARAFCSGALVLPARPYLERNREIVRASDALLAVPNLPEEALRSGTWATVRYARRQSKPITIIWPNGQLEVQLKEQV